MKSTINDGLTRRHVQELGEGGFKISTFSMPNAAYERRYQGVVKLALSRAPLLVQPLVFRTRGASDQFQTAKNWLLMGRRGEIEKEVLHDIGEALTSPLARWRLYSAQFYPGRGRLWLVDTQFKGAIEETPTKALDLDLTTEGACGPFLVIRHEEGGGRPAKYRLTPLGDGTLIVDVYKWKGSESPASTFKIYDEGEKTWLEIMEYSVLPDDLELVVRGFI